MSHGVRYAVLRNHESLPYRVGARDIDILVLPENLPMAVDAVRAVAGELDCLFAKYYRDDMICQFTLFKRIDQNQPFELVIDFLTNRQVYGVELLSASQMLQNSRLHNGIHVVAEEYVFLDKWLFNLLVGKPLNSKYDAEFALICARKKNILLPALTPLLGERLALELVESVGAGSASKLAPLAWSKRVALLARVLFQQGIIGARRFAGFLGHRIRDRLSPSGIFISVSGPDGSGKTTVIDKVIADLKTIYGADSVIYRHFRPAALPRIADVAKAARAIETVDSDYSNPHRAQPSGPVGSFVRLAYYYFDYFIGYFRSVRPALIKRQVVLFDRYYYDMICDPGRSRIRLPYRLLRLVALLLPLPAYAFFIDVSADEIYRRKQELSLDRIRELNLLYLALVPSGVLRRIDNNGPSEHAAAEIVDAIIKDRDNQARRLLAGFPE